MKVFVLEDDLYLQGRICKILKKIGISFKSIIVTRKKEEILADMFTDGNQNLYILDTDMQSTTESIF